MTEQNKKTGYKICTHLNGSEKCFRLQQYYEGSFKELFHEHVPSHRISAGNASEFLTSLILRYSGLEDKAVLRAFLNNKGKEPDTINLCRISIEYPETGVVRKYFDGGNLLGWYDEVVSPSTFRAGASEQE